MLGATFVWILFAICLVSAIRRPWTGCVSYYFFVLLQPKWNWSWSIPISVSFQKYLVLATLVGILLSGFKWGRLSSRTRRVMLALIGFVALAWISAHQSIDPDGTWYLFGSIWKLTLMLFLTSKLVDTPDKLRILLWAVTIGQSYNAFRINEEYFRVGYCRYVYDIWGFTGSNQTAIIALCALAISVGLLFFERRWPLRLLALFLTLLQTHQIMLLESRGSMLGIALLLFASICLMPKTTISVASLAIALIAGSILAGPGVTKEFASIFASENERDSSASSRFKTWTAGLKVVQERPMLGAGVGASSILVPEYYDGPLRAGGTKKNIHNLPIEVAADCGIPAAILYISYFAVIPLIACAALHSRILGRPDPWSQFCSASGISSLGGVIGVSVASLFSSALLIEVFYLLVVVGLLNLDFSNHEDESMLGLQAEFNEGPGSLTA